MLDEDFINQLMSNDKVERFLEEGAAFRTLMAYYRCAIMEVETKFNVLNTEFSLRYDRNPIETIKSRLKSAESIIEKLHRKNIPFSAESIEKNLSDIAGIRVVCAFPEDIYMLSECLLEQDDITLVEKKDYIANPKPNGYRSLHLIVETPIFLHNQKRIMKVEVQLRTIAMDFWASLEHRLYYKKGHEDVDLRKELKECAEISAALDLRMQGIRGQLEE
ncbi:MAG: GTP pyrophosphokinase family protein [Lachnospiraceae bacterium]|nr:GTP pyrophosphokinase family protein [Lachnospiraceae bacterium]